MAQDDGRLIQLLCDEGRNVLGVVRLPGVAGVELIGLAVASQDCLYVGDGGSNELTGALQVGMHPVRIRVPYEDASADADANREEWRGLTVSALKDILTLVE